MRQLLYKLGLVNLVWFTDFDGTYLRIVWYGDGKKYVKKWTATRKLRKQWFELRPDGKVAREGITQADFRWDGYKTPPKLHLSPFSFLKSSRAIEVKQRLE